jgi:hypothetical protein
VNRHKRRHALAVILLGLAIGLAVALLLDSWQFIWKGYDRLCFAQSCKLVGHPIPKNASIVVSAYATLST